MSPGLRRKTASIGIIQSAPVPKVRQAYFKKDGPQNPEKREGKKEKTDLVADIDQVVVPGLRRPWEDPNPQKRNQQSGPNRATISTA